MRILFSTLLFFFTTFSAYAGTGEKWTIVPNKDVCMVTNVHFARPQIPVTHEGKTYYGCCENCKATLQNDPSSRTATDPVSQKSVDKAAATIAADATGAVLYFENPASFQKFKSQAKASKNK